MADVDLESFFDRVGHDKLMHRVARRVADRRLLRLIAVYLKAGILVDGVKQPTAEGTPQGSPLSPLLSNIMLDDLDILLEQRGHRFVRYADDVRVFMRSERAARRVLDGVTAFAEERLALRVNREKSTISPASMAGLLGFGFFFTVGGVVGIRVHAKAWKRLKARVRQLTRRTAGRSIEHLLAGLNRFVAGWCAYFGVAAGRKRFEALDKWVRHRLRAIQWKRWKRYRTKRRNLVALGVSDDQAAQWAATSKGTWRIAGSVVLQVTLPKAHWDDLGYRGFSHHWHRRRAA